MLEGQAEAEITRNSNPLVLSCSTTLSQAAREMDSHHVSAVVVVEDDAAIIGIFTGRDAVTRVLARGRDPGKTTLGEVMTYNPVIAAPHQTAITVLRMMQDAHCRHLPIVQDGKVVGLISRGDFRGKDQESLDERRS